MEYRAKQRILNWGISNGWEAPKEMFNILSHQGNANQNDPEIPPHFSKNGSVQKFRWQQMSVRMWRKRTTPLCWLVCKLVQPLWKSVWHFLRKLEIVLPEDQLYHSWAYTQKILQQGHMLHYVHSSLIYNSQKLERTQMPLNRNGYRKCGTFTKWSTTKLFKGMNLWNS